MESRTHYKLTAYFYMVQEIPDFRAARQKEFSSKCHAATLVTLLCKNVYIEEQPVTMTLLTWLNQTAVVILVLQPL